MNSYYLNLTKEDNNYKIHKVKKGSYQKPYTHCEKTLVKTIDINVSNPQNIEHIKEIITKEINVRYLSIIERKKINENIKFCENCFPFWKNF